MVYNIEKYGAKADGVTNNRKAIQKAIDDCSNAGGGRVVIPAGKYASGTLTLKSFVELHLETGAVLTCCLDEDPSVDSAFPYKDSSPDMGWDGGCFLCAFHARDISITGSGVIYGRGDQIFYDDGADGDFHECPENVRTEKRPRLTFFEDIQNLTVTGVTFRDAAFWTLHMAGCRCVLIDGIRIQNDPRGANNDGIDPDTCKNVVISNCIIQTGDDAIVVKNSEAIAKKYGNCENIIIHHCILSSHDSALKIGTETFQGIRNILLSDCEFLDCSRGIGIWARDGAVIEEIHVHHVTGNVKRFADCPGRKFAPRWWGKGEPVFISATPRKNSRINPGKIRNVSFDHVYLTAESSVFISGEENSAIQNVEIQDMHLTLVRQGTQSYGIFDEQPSERDVYEHAVPAVFARWVENLTVDGKIKRTGGYRKYPLVELVDCKLTEISVKELESDYEASHKMPL
jgi:polygalacturonase